MNSDLIIHNKYGVYSKNELETKLREEHLTVKGLGSIYSLNVSQMAHVLRSLDITYRNPINETRVIGFEITPSVHQVLLGTLLGDGYMKVPKSYSLGHSINQMDYFYNVAEKLGPSVSSIRYNETKFGKSLLFWTHRHNLFTQYFDSFYSHGRKKKFFYEKSAHDLEPEGLAYWYMDDGKFDEYGAYLCVGNISKEEGLLLVNLIKSKFNIVSNLQVHDLKKGYYNIYIRAESRPLFFSLINPYIISSMQYKLTGEPYPKLDSKHKIIKRHAEFCRKIKRSINLYGGENL